MGNKHKNMKDYILKSNNQVKSSINAAQDDINELAKLLGDIMVKDGVIQLFGVNHDHALSMELGFRAGGLVQYHIIDLDDLPLRGHVSNEEYASEDFLNNRENTKLFFDIYNIQENDAFLLYVAEEVHPMLVELAKLAKEKGYPVYLFTSRKAVVNNNEQLANELFSYADKILDLNIPSPDTFVDVNGVLLTQVSNLVANMFAQVITMEIYTYLKSIDHDPAVLWSMNVAGADEHNKKLVEKYDGRWNS